MSLILPGFVSLHSETHVFGLIERNKKYNASHQNISWSQQQIRDELTQAIALGGFLDSELVAVMFFRPMGDAMDITYITTDFALRRQGVMSPLLQLARVIFSSLRFCLEVHEGNKEAILFYEKMGFCLDGQRPRYYSDGAACRLYSLKPWADITPCLD